MSKSTRLDQYLSPARDSQGGVRPRLRYLLCSSPRCGSTLFGQMLFDSGVMGDPLEYLNPSYAAAFFRRFPGHSNSVDAILSTLEGLRTAPSGLFGMQLHFSHFQTLYPDDTAKRQFLARFDRLVFMRRRNKFAQAASLYRATHTGLWSSLEEDIRQAAGSAPQAPDDVLTATGLASALAAIVGQDMGWEGLLSAVPVPVMTVYYEDLVADWGTECAKAIAWLGGGSLEAEEVPAMALRKQAAPHDQRLSDIAAYLGCRVSS